MNEALKSLHPSAYPLINMEYADQLEAKTKKMARLFEQFGKGAPICAMQTPYGYMNKLTAHFGRGKTGKLITGNYNAQRGKTFAVESYPMHAPVLDKTLACVRAAANFCKYEPYHAESGKGMVRAVVLREGARAGEVMVVLVTGQAILPGAKNFVKKLRTLCQNQNIEVSTVIQNVNEWQTNLVLGEREKVLFGKGFVVEELCGRTFALSPSAYFPSNAAQTEVLYAAALEGAALTGAQTVVHLYSGMGALALASARKAVQVYGVDVNEAAVQDAVGNMRHNGVPNVHFSAENPVEWAQRHCENGLHADVVFVEPPRARMEAALLDAVLRLKPARVVYLAHSPEEQVRDIAALVKGGYEMETYTPVDLAPYTNYISGVITLVKK